MRVPLALTGITAASFFLGAIAMAAEPEVLSPSEAKLSWTGPIFDNAQVLHQLRDREGLKRFETAAWIEPGLSVPRMGVAFAELPPQRTFVATHVRSLDDQIEFIFAKFDGTTLQLPGGGGGEPPYGTWETRKFDIRNPDRSCLASRKFFGSIGDYDYLSGVGPEARDLGNKVLYGWYCAGEDGAIDIRYVPGCISVEPYIVTDCGFPKVEQAVVTAEVQPATNTGTPMGADRDAGTTGAIPVRLVDPASIPYLSARGRKAFELYKGAPWHKAFAMSLGGALGYAYSMTTEGDAKQTALVTCKRYTHYACNLFAVNEDIVWSRTRTQLARVEPGTESEAAGSGIELVLDGRWEGVAEDVSGILVYSPDAPAGEIRLNAGVSETDCKGVWQATEVTTDGDIESSGTWALTCANGLAGSGTFESYQRRDFLTRGGFLFWSGCDSRLVKEIHHVSMYCSSG